jgi:hypothetical protein
MTADVTIHITFGSAAGTDSQTSSAMESPSPLPLEQIQGTADDFGAPAPQSVSELTTQETGGMTSDTAPAPMPVEQLQMTAAVSEAPGPLESMAGDDQGPPSEVLGASGSAEPSPEPLPIDELGKPGSES